MPTFPNPLRGGSDSEPWNPVGSGDSDKPKPGNWTSDLHRNLVLLWHGLWNGSQALRDPELRAARGRTGCRYRGGAGGSSSPLLLRLRFFYSPLDSPSKCQHPLDLAPKTPLAFLFGTILSQFFLYPVPRYKTPAPPSSLCAHTHTFSRGPRETQTLHAPTGYVSKLCLLLRSFAPMSPRLALWVGAKGTLVPPSFSPVGFSGERS